MESFLRGRRDDGAKLLVVYITGGYEGWEAAVETAAAAGADAIEIGIPFSDPVMDGPVICLLYTSPSPRDLTTSRMRSSA